MGSSVFRRGRLQTGSALVLGLEGPARHRGEGILPLEALAPTAGRASMKRNDFGVGPQDEGEQCHRPRACRRACRSERSASVAVAGRSIPGPRSCPRRGTQRRGRASASSVAGESRPAWVRRGWAGTSRPATIGIQRGLPPSVAVNGPVASDVNSCRHRPSGYPASLSRKICAAARDDPPHPPRGRSRHRGPPRLPACPGGTPAPA